MKNVLFSFVLVLHVKEGYKDRAVHIESMLKKHQISFQYILDGDLSDLTPAILNRYFKNNGSTNMYGIFPRTSCALKHILAYEFIIQNHLKGALILEDDAIIHRNFINVFNKTMTEAKDRSYVNYIISYEDSRLCFVPKSQRLKERMLYVGDKDRMAGAYYIDFQAAKCILDYIYRNKCTEPIDLLHSRLIRENKLTYYWCQPTVISQGSFTGLFKTSISFKKKKYEALTWFLKLHYKKILYYFR